MTSRRRRLLEDMQVRQLAPSTQLAYVQHVARLERHPVEEAQGRDGDQRRCQGHVRAPSGSTARWHGT